MTSRRSGLQPYLLGPTTFAGHFDEGCSQAGDSVIVIPWSAVLIARDILVALIFVVVFWLFSILLRFGESLDDEWMVFASMLFVALVVLLFRWGVLVVL